MGLDQNPIHLATLQFPEHLLGELQRAARNERWSHTKLGEQSPEAETVQVQPCGPYLLCKCFIWLTLVWFCFPFCFCCCCQHFKIEIFYIKFLDSQLLFKNQMIWLYWGCISTCGLSARSLWQWLFHLCCLPHFLSPPFML